MKISKSALRSEYATINSSLLVIRTVYLNLEALVPDGLQCVAFGFSALYFVFRLTNEQGHEWVCLANEVGVLDILGFDHCYVQYPNWVKLQEAALSNVDI